MRRSRPGTLFFQSLLCLCIVIVGCSARKDYAYQDIKRQYSRLSCPGPDTATAAAEHGQGLVCDLSAPLSLENAVSLALSNSPDDAVALSRMAQADAAAQKARALFYPSVNLYTEHLQADAPSAYLFKKIDQRMLPSDVNFNDPGLLSNFQSGVKLSYNIYKGGRDMLSTRLADTRREISAIERTGVVNTLVASVIETFYDALAARAFIDIARESAATVAEQLRIMTVRYDAGGALKSDILSLKVRLAQAEEAVVRSENRYSIALARLESLLGVRFSRTPVLAEPAIDGIPLPGAFDRGLAYALDHRPELLTVRQQVRAAQMALDLQHTGYRPRVDFQVEYYLDDPDMAYDLQRDNWTAAVLLSWNIFSGFSTRADIEEAKAKIAEILAVDRKTLLAVELDVKTAYLRLTEATARLAVARQSVASAEESLKLVKYQYEGGSAPVTRYLEAELDRSEAKTRATSAFYDREKAMANIGRAIGYWADHTETKRKITPP